MTHKFPQRIRHITTEDKSLPHIAHVITNFHIQGVIGYGEWIDRLKEAGLNAMAGFTILTIDQQERRLKTLTKKYPRIGGIVNVAAAVASVPASTTFDCEPWETDEYTWWDEAEDEGFMR